MNFFFTQKFFIHIIKQVGFLLLLKSGLGRRQFFLSAQAFDFFFKRLRLRLLDFFPKRLRLLVFSSSGSGS